MPHLKSSQGTSVVCVIIIICDNFKINWRRVYELQISLKLLGELLGVICILLVNIQNNKSQLEISLLVDFDFYKYSRYKMYRCDSFNLVIYKFHIIWTACNGLIQNV